MSIVNTAQTKPTTVNVPFVKMNAVNAVAAVIPPYTAELFQERMVPLAFGFNSEIKAYRGAWPKPTAALQQVLIMIAAIK